MDRKIRAATIWAMALMLFLSITSFALQLEDITQRIVIISLGMAVLFGVTAYIWKDLCD